MVASRTQCATKFLMKRNVCLICATSPCCPSALPKDSPLFVVVGSFSVCTRRQASPSLCTSFMSAGGLRLTPQFELLVQLSGCDKQKVVSLQRVCHSPLSTALSQSAPSPGLGRKDISGTAGEMPVRSGTWLIVMY